jgi:hypothetical protein
LAAPALPRVVPVVAVGEEVGAYRAQEGAEPTSIWIGLGQQALLKRSREKVLRQVSGLLWAITPAANVGIQGIPVGAAELGERLSG